MSSTGDYDAVRKDIVALLHQPEYDDGSAGPVLVRLACGGGGDPSNAGLQHARVFLEPIKEKHPWITYSDLWVLGGIVAVEQMGGPKIPFRQGRTDYVDDSKLPPRGRLPDGALGADHVRFIFYRMGFNDQEIVALSGAHNLGRCHSDRSGFNGAWVNNPTRFSNQYFRLLTTLEWKEQTLPNGFKQFMYIDEDLDEELMMLPTDMALLWDSSFSVWVKKYAEDKDLFFADFAKAFDKLMELGIERDESGKIVNTDNVKGGYVSAPKKSNIPGAVEWASKDAAPLAQENERFRAKL